MRFHLVYPPFAHQPSESNVIIRLFMVMKTSIRLAIPKIILCLCHTHSYTQLTHVRIDTHTDTYTEAPAPHTHANKPEKNRDQNREDSFLCCFFFKKKEAENLLEASD